MTVIDFSDWRDNMDMENTSNVRVQVKLRAQAVEQLIIWANNIQKSIDIDYSSK